MGSRFLEYLRIKGLSQKKICQLSSVSESLLSRFCSGGAITSDRLQRILHVCDDLSLEWFFFGTGDMFRSRGGDTTYNYGKYAGADIVRDKGVMVKSDNVHLGTNPSDDLISEKDRIILEKDKIISERDKTIGELLKMLNKL